MAEGQPTEEKVAEKPTDIVTRISAVICRNGDVGVECQGEVVAKATAVGVLEMAKQAVLQGATEADDEAGKDPRSQIVTATHVPPQVQ